MRGEEILSGGQRIHDAPMLEQRMKACGVDPETMLDYVNGFRWGCPPVSLVLFNGCRAWHTVLFAAVADLVLLWRSTAAVALVWSASLCCS